MPDDDAPPPEVEAEFDAALDMDEAIWLAAMARKFEE